MPRAGEGGEPGPAVLHISYDGILESLGQAQVLPYVERLRACGVKVCLLTFEKMGATTAVELTVLRDRLQRKGIVWTALRYHKSPRAPATAYDIIAGILVGWLIVRHQRVRVVHARSYVAGCVALALKRLLGVRFLFDMRGFWVDERIQGKIWRPSERLYRWAKAYEAMCLKAADAIVSLTEAAKREIEAFDYLSDRCPPITVIPTCVDLDRFQPWASSPNTGPDKPWRLVYSGALGTWYLLDEMIAFFCAIKKRIPRAQFLILTQTPEAVTVPVGFAAEDLDVHGVPFAEMPRWIARGNVGVVFSRPSWADKARCPTKLGEFLACGLPVVISRGIGDTETIVREERVGVVVHKLARPAYEQAAEDLLALLSEADLRERCRRAAARHFSLEDGVLRYLQLYERLIRL